MTDNLMAGQQAAEEMMGLLKKSGVSDTEHIQIGIAGGRSFISDHKRKTCGIGRIINYKQKRTALAVL